MNIAIGSVKGLKFVKTSKPTLLPHFFGYGTWVYSIDIALPLFAGNVSERLQGQPKFQRKHQTRP